MDPGLIKLLIVAAYLGLLLGLGLFAGRLFKGSSSDYMLASHSIGPFLLLMSLFGTTMTGFALVGSTGEAYREGAGVYGLLASSSGIVHSLCFFVLGIPLWRLGRKYGYTTQVQFFRDRLASDKIGLVLFPILVGLVVPYLLVGLISGERAMQGFTIGTFAGGEDHAFYSTPKGAVAPWVTGLVVSVVVLTYVFFGGMRGTAWANAFQTGVFMILGVVTFAIIAGKLGATGPDGQAVTGGLLENIKAASAKIPDSKLVREDFTQLRWLSYIFIPLSVGMFPHLFQHWLTARSAESFKLPVTLHPVFIMIVWVPCVLMGVWAAAEGVFPSVPRPNTELGLLVNTNAGPVLGGCIAAGILAAIMSSLDSQFLCLGTMFTEDIVLHYFGRNADGSDRYTDAQVVKIARGFIIGIVVVTFLLSLQDSPRVFQLGIWCFSGFASLFPLCFAALYWPKLTKAGAYACVLTAFATWLALFADADYAKDENYLLTLPFGENLQVMPVAGMIAASTLALVVVSLVTPKPAPATVAKFFPKLAMNAAAGSATTSATSATSATDAV